MSDKQRYGAFPHGKPAQIQQKEYKAMAVKQARKTQPYQISYFNLLMFILISCLAAYFAYTQGWFDRAIRAANEYFFPPKPYSDSPSPIPVLSFFQENRRLLTGLFVTLFVVLVFVNVVNYSKDSLREYNIVIKNLMEGLEKKKLSFFQAAIKKRQWETAIATYSSTNKEERVVRGTNKHNQTVEKSIWRAYSDMLPVHKAAFLTALEEAWGTYKAKEGMSFLAKQMSVIEHVLDEYFRKKKDYLHFFSRPDQSDEDERKVFNYPEVIFRKRVTPPPEEK